MIVPPAQLRFHAKHRPGPDDPRAIGGLTGACLALCAVLSACSSPEDIADKAGVTATATAAASGSAATATAALAGAEGVEFEDNAEQNNRTREFTYAWPAAASAIPALAQFLTTERDAAVAEQKSEWAALLAEADIEDCASCYNLSFSKEWKVVTNLPRFLSLSADMYFYSGGAHGNSGFDALVWDREAGTAIKPTAMFRSEAALQDALGDAWCKALKAEKQERMGEDYSEDGFFPCPPIADLTVLLGSSNKTTFNRIGLIAAPYVAGSYAEGPYEVTLPVTPAVLKAVKPEYKPVFALPK
jgi:hypothetical protein